MPWISRQLYWGHKMSWSETVSRWPACHWNAQSGYILSAIFQRQPGWAYLYLCVNSCRGSSYMQISLLKNKFQCHFNAKERRPPTCSNRCSSNSEWCVMPDTKIWGQTQTIISMTRSRPTVMSKHVEQIFSCRPSSWFRSPPGRTMTCSSYEQALIIVAFRFGSTLTPHAMQTKSSIITK